MRIPGRIVAVAVALMTTIGLSFLLLSCTGDSAEVAIRQVSLSIAGIYRNDGSSNNGKLVSNNTGAPVTQLDLRQTGDQLEAIDNNGILFKGTLGQETESSGSFTLDGQTTVGNEATISGTITKSGDTSADMRGTWIEPSLYATVVGIATVPSNAPTSSGGGSSNSTTLAISPTSATLTNDGDTQVFSATGGSGSFTWLVVSGNGDVSPDSGTPVTYTRLASGANTITVSSGSNSASASISQP